MGILLQEFNSSDIDADYGSFLLDKMHIYLWPTRPYENLTDIFEKIKGNKEYQEEFEEGRLSYNLMR